MQHRDHATQSSWHSLEENHWPFKGIFVWVETLLAIAVAYKYSSIFPYSMPGLWQKEKKYFTAFTLN